MKEAHGAICGDSALSLPAGWAWSEPLQAGPPRYHCWPLGTFCLVLVLLSVDASSVVSGALKLLLRWSWSTETTAFPSPQPFRAGFLGPAAHLELLTHAIAWAPGVAALGRRQTFL